MKVIRILCEITVIIGCGVLQASELFNGYDINQSQIQIPKQQTQRALEYDRAYNMDTKSQPIGFYDKLKKALGFRAATQPRPRIAEYEKAFSTYDYKSEPWNTPWYENRTYEEPLPDDVKRALDMHQEELKHAGAVSSFEWLPGYIIKRESTFYPSRIEGAKKFMSAIKAERNPMIYIPQKYEYTPADFNRESNGYLIISEKIPQSNDPITKDEAKAIKKIAENTRWGDARTDNVFKIAPGRLAIIDTEPLFYWRGDSEKIVKKGVNKNMLFNGVRSFSPAAKEYLENKYKQYQKPKSPFITAPSKRNFYSRMGL